MIRKMAALAAVTLVSWGCFSSAPGKTYLQIHLEEGTAPAPRFEKALFIAPILADDLYDDFRILYRLSPYEVNYYTLSFWAEKPSKMIHQSLTRYFAARNIFARVVLNPAGTEADWILRGTLHKIEEIDAEAAWAAGLAMDLEIAEAKTGIVLAVRRFDRREPLAKKNVAEVPVVLSRILAEEVAALFAELKGK
jgi:cholesterol transport system auxiliary component